MSDVRSKTASFFELYRAGQVAESAIHDFIKDWHASGDEETRSLSAFLGMSDEEYAIWVMDRRTLPLLRTTRQAHGDLIAAVACYVNELHAAEDPVNRAAIHGLSHWVRRHQG